MVGGGGVKMKEDLMKVADKSKSDKVISLMRLKISWGVCVCVFGIYIDFQYILPAK